MGPLALLDLIGLDTSLSILEVLHGEFGGSRYVPAAAAAPAGQRGRTGRKAGRGIYDYASKDGQAVRERGTGAAPRRSATVTLIGSGSPAEAELASAAAAAGINVTRNPAHASDLVVIAAAPDERVLPTALEAGRPEQRSGCTSRPRVSRR